MVKTICMILWPAITEWPILRVVMNLMINGISRPMSSLPRFIGHLPTI